MALSRPVCSSRAGLFGAPLLFALALLALPACGGSGEGDLAGCETDFDCSVRETCIAERCIPRACSDDDDCPGGRCSGSQCVAADASSTPSNGGSGTTSRTPGGTSSGNGGSSTSGGSSTPPIPHPTTGATVDPDDCVVGEPPFCIVHLDPAPGTSDLPLDFTWRATFSQAIDPTSFGGGFNLSLRTLTGSGSRAPALDIQVDPETPRLLEARIADPSDVSPGSYYRLRLERLLRARTNANLGVDFNWPVRTALPGDRDFLQALAEAWAPVLHQEIEDLRIDTPTRVDFDDDLDARNNLDNATASLPPTLYWSASASETHWFLHYFVYYPGGIAGQAEGTELKPHDTLTLNLAIRREAEAPFGALEAAWTWNALSPEHFYAVPTADLPAERPLGRRQQLPADRQFVRLAPDDLEEGRRIHFLITAGRHQVCLASATTNARQEWAPCGGSTDANAPFREGFEHRIYRPGEGETPASDAFGDGFTYALLPFDDELWLRRDLHPVGPRDGTPPDGGALFESPSPYLGPDDRPPQRPEDGTAQELHPKFLLTPDAEEGVTDNSRAATPFAHSSFIRSGSGVGIMDPAWLIHEALRTDEAFSLEYCFHLHQRIDRRAEDPETCAFPAIPDEGSTSE